MLADSLKALLEQKGFQVEAVYDGESGEEYAQLGVYDLLILDVMSPGWTATSWPAGCGPAAVGCPF